MLQKEEIENIKKQLIEQINSTFPENKRADAISQIKAMNKKQLEEFLEQNDLIKNQGKQKCIFCSIIFGDIFSHKIAENEKAIAILEINPISEGHSLVIPKEHLSSRKEFSDEIFLLANEVKERIIQKLKPKDVEVSTQNIMGHEIMNILPIYENENINSPRQKADENKLKELQDKLSNKKSTKIKKFEEKVSRIKQFDAKDLWLPERIP
jgi:histidine triad (HIT) family protein